MRINFTRRLLERDPKAASEELIKVEDLARQKDARAERAVDDAKQAAEQIRGEALDVQAVRGEHVGLAAEELLGQFKSFAALVAGLGAVDLQADVGLGTALNLFEVTSAATVSSDLATRTPTMRMRCDSGSKSYTASEVITGAVGTNVTVGSGGTSSLVIVTVNRVPGATAV